MQIKMRWLGNAGFEFQIEGIILMIDPFLTRPKTHQVFSGRVQPDESALKKHIQVCDHILVTHAHFDHSMDAPAIARRTGAVVHGSGNTCKLMRAAGISSGQIHEITFEDEFLIGDIAIKVLPAAHPWLPGYTKGKLRPDLCFPLRLRDYRMDSCFSFLVRSGTRRILIWSSTKNNNAPAADVLTCRAVSSRSWYRKLLLDVNPGLVIPQHWDDFFQPLSENPQPYFSTPRLGFPPLQRIDLQNFEQRIELANPHSRVLLPKIFKTYDLSSL